MIAKTHVAFALGVSSIGLLFVSVVTGVNYDPRLLILFLCGVAIGALLPDIDEPQSTIGKKTFFVSHWIKRFFGHRGATHTLLFPLVMGGVFYLPFFYFGFSLFAFLGLIIGCYLHIVGDMMTKSGCPIYLPISSRNVGLMPRSCRFITGGAVDHAIGKLSMIVFTLCSAHFAGFDLSWILSLDIERFLKILG